MANWKWMFPPQTCGECQCRRRVWRSTRNAFGVWSTPVMVAEEIGECAEGHGWQLIAPCVAEYINYEKCQNPGAPALPTIPAPDCPQTPAPTCPTCLPDIGTQVQIDIPGAWGTMTGTPAITIREVCGETPICNPCNDVPAMTFISSWEPWTYLKPTCSIAYQQIDCGPGGSICSLVANAQYCYTHQCCYVTPPFGPRPPPPPFPKNLPLAIGVSVGMVTALPSYAGCKLSASVFLESLIYQDFLGGVDSLHLRGLFESSAFVSVPPVLGSPITLSRTSMCYAYSSYPAPFGIANTCSNFPTAITVTLS